MNYISYLRKKEAGFMKKLHYLFLKGLSFMAFGMAFLGANIACNSSHYQDEIPDKVKKYRCL